MKIQGGFLSDTKIKLRNGRQKSICDIEFRDILEDGGLVQNIYKITPTHQFKFETVFPGKYGFNIIAEVVQENFNDLNNNIFEDELPILYNLNTSTGTFKVNGIQVLDYDNSRTFRLNKNYCSLFNRFI